MPNKEEFALLNGGFCFFSPRAAAEYEPGISEFLQPISRIKIIFIIAFLY